MTRIRQVERELREMASGLNPMQYAEAQRAIDAEKAKAARFQADKLNELSARIRDGRQEWQRGCCEVRDELRALAKEGRKGHMSAADYTARLSALEGRLTSAEADYETQQGELSQLQSVEEGPEGWEEIHGEPWSASDYYDDFHERFPELGRMVEATPRSGLSPEEWREAVAAGVIKPPQESKQPTA
jgi:hypothetical protein